MNAGGAVPGVWDTLSRSPERKGRVSTCFMY